MKNNMSATQTGTDIEAAEALKTAKENILNQLKKRIIGQDAVIEQLLIALFSQGHCLLVGVPGLAKTLAHQHIRADLGTPFQSDSIHTGPDALGYYRHRYY